MNHFKVKVCGITRVSDIHLAVDLGVDMLGMIFYNKSPRFVNQQTALRLVREIPLMVLKVGVFVNENIDKITGIGKKLKLDFIQLHGDETAGDIQALKKEGFKVIKAFHIQNKSDFEKVMKCGADMVLLDNAGKDIAGGTGATFDWSVKPPQKLENLIIAGGINVKNVSECVSLFAPAVIDVNSGIEDSPGKKSNTKMIEFFIRCNRLRYAGSKDTK